MLSRSEAQAGSLGFMKVVIADRTGNPRVVQLPEPRVTRGCVAIRVSHCAVNIPREMAVIRDAASFLDPGEDGRPLGSGVSGIIDEVGEGVKSLRGGLRVAAFGPPYVYHAERLVVPENLVVEIPKKVNHEEGAFCGLGAVALHQLRSSGLQLGDTAVVLGCELAGVLLAQVLRSAGVTPILVDSSEHRLNRARNLGLPHAIGPGESDALLRLVESITGGEGVDAVFLTERGDRAALTAAAALLRIQGTVVVAAELDQLDLPSLALERRLRVLTALEPGPGRHDPGFEFHGFEYPRPLVPWNERRNMACFAQLLAERKVQLSPLVTDRTPLERAPMVYEKIVRSPDSVMAALMTV